MNPDIESILISEEELGAKVREMGEKITRRYAGREPLFVGVLKGSFVFMADVLRCIDLPCSVDFMAVSSYGAGTESSGRVRIDKDLGHDIKGRDVVILEDILDSGTTLHYLLKVLAERGPDSLAVYTLLDKPARRKKEVKAEMTGFTIPDAFVVGYGLDYDEKYRNLPYIGVLRPEVYGG